MGEHLPLVHRFAADAASLPLTRILVRHWLAEGGVDLPAADEVLFVANELAAHGVGVHPGGWCQLDARRGDGRILLRVTGRPAPEAAVRAAGHLAAGSLALEVLHHLCAAVDVDDEAGSVSVSCPVTSARSGVPPS